MFELSVGEIDSVSGGAKAPVGPAPAPAPARASKSGTMERPCAGESEIGRVFNDIAATSHALGQWVGIAIYDLVN